MDMINSWIAGHQWIVFVLGGVVGLDHVLARLPSLKSNSTAQAVVGALGKGLDWIISSSAIQSSPKALKVLSGFEKITEGLWLIVGPSEEAAVAQAKSVIVESKK